MDTMHEWSQNTLHLSKQEGGSSDMDSERISGNCSLWDICDSKICHYKTELSGNNGTDESGEKQAKWRCFTNGNEMLAGLLKCRGSFRVSNYTIIHRE